MPASYETAASQSAGAAAEQAAERKCLKYAELSAAYEFHQVAIETHGLMDEATIFFLNWPAKSRKTRTTLCQSLLFPASQRAHSAI